MSEYRYRFDRRALLKAGLGAAATGTLASLGLGSLDQAASATTSRSARLRRPNSLPYPGLPAGVYTGAFYFDHIVIVMQENHSFDNYLGMLPVCGQPRADGFTFNRKGEPVNWNPVPATKPGAPPERMYVYHQSGEDGATDTGSQTWDDSHIQIDHGAMDGFAATGPGSMGYYTEDDLPFYYSLARTFTLANRWFCSVPAQTYPNRRFLMAATASGIVSTDINNIGVQPANGTIWDRLSAHGISWLNYFTDLPTTAIIESTVTSHPANYARIEQFYADAAAGALPAVSLVDCDYGAVTGQVGGQLRPPTFGSTPSAVLDTTAESEENPQNVQLGEAFVARIVDAVMSGPAWHRTLLIWTYDEHGGYYDHVAPPAALAPDSIPPAISSTDYPGGYNLLGPRVPAVVVSPYARRNSVTNQVHDHTSILATIEAQWNLPALTWRDANAATLADFLDPSRMHFSEPPTLAPPANPVPGLLAGYRGQPAPPPPGSTTPR